MYVKIVEGLCEEKGYTNGIRLILLTSYLITFSFLWFKKTSQVELTVFCRVLVKSILRGKLFTIPFYWINTHGSRQKYLHLNFQVILKPYTKPYVLLTFTQLRSLDIGIWLSYKVTSDRNISTNYKFSNFFFS